MPVLFLFPFFFDFLFLFLVFLFSSFCFLKSILLTKDKLVVGFGTFTGQEAPSRPDEKPISRAEVRIFNEQGELEGELDLPAGVIPSGLSSAYGRLFVTCDDGTLSCFGQ